jgi:processive 1,2-diacylglycerol beta-glucosyltransferase
VKEVNKLQCSALDNKRIRLKKIIIFTSTGGGGHSSASTMLQEMCKNTYNVTTVNIFSDLLGSLDIFKKVSFGLFTGEQLYNALISRQYINLIRLLFYRGGSAYIVSQHDKIIKQLYTYIDQEKPDLIISVVPFINDCIVTVAKETSIPFLLLPTDLNIEIYIKNIAEANYDKFYIGLPFFDPDVISMVEKIKVKSTNIYITGPMVRSAFLEHYATTESKEPRTEKTIMIMMGSQGSTGIITYLKQLSLIDYPIRVIACIGKNIWLKNKITSLRLTYKIDVLSFTDDIASKMASADLLISKSGTISLCESIALNIPIILDHTSAILPWEQFNHEFIEKYQLGLSIKTKAAIAPVINDLLSNPEKLERYKTNLKQFVKKNVFLTLPVYINAIIEKEGA